MVTIPRVTDPTVRPAGLPDVSLRAQPGAGLENLGEGLQRASVSIQGAVDRMQQERERSRSKAEGLALLQREMEMVQSLNDSLYAPGSGLLNAQGEAALGLTERGLKSFDAFSAEQLKKAGSEDMRLRMQTMHLRQRMSLAQTLARHEADEFQKHTKNVFENSTLVYSQQAANNYNNPEILNQSLASIRESVQTYGSANGWTPEIIASEQQRRATVLHESVIARMMEQRDYGRAKAYFDANRDGMTQEQRLKLEPAIDKGMIEAHGINEADKILAEKSHMSDKALDNYIKNNIKDETMRRVVRERVLEVRAARERERQATNRAAFDRAYDQVVQGGSLEQVDTLVREQLTDEQRATLKARAKLAAAGKQPVTDPETLYRLVDQYVDPDARGEFARINLNEYGDRLSPSDLQALQKLQGSGARLPYFTALKSASDAAMRSVGITPGAGDAREYKFRQQLDRMLDPIVAAGKQPTADEIQRASDALTMQMVFDRGGPDWLTGSRKLRAFETEADLDDLAEIRDMLQANGKPVNDLTVQRAYEAMQAGDRATFRQLVGAK